MGLFAVWLYYLMRAPLAWHKRRFMIGRNVSIVVSVLTICVSVIAGHVLQSAMLGPIISIFIWSAIIFPHDPNDTSSSGESLTTLADNRAL